MSKNGNGAETAVAGLQRQLTISLINEFHLRSEDATRLATLWTAMVTMRPETDYDEWVDSEGKAAAQARRRKIKNAEKLLERSLSLYSQAMGLNR